MLTQGLMQQWTMNAGEYTLAFTCQADQDFAADDADDPDGNADDDILFSDSINVDVTLGSLDDANFIAP